MQRRSAILGSMLFFFIAPAMIAGLVPWWISRWQVQASFFGLASVRAAGVALIAIGIPVLLESFARFALQGQGTPAPVGQLVIWSSRGISLRPQSDLPCGHRDCSGPRSVLRKRHAPGL